MCPAYIAGLIGPGDRKSVQPMAARAGDASYDQLHHFVSSGVWDAAPLEAALLTEADAQVGGDGAWLIIDDTSLPKKGTHSVGVAPQYASTLGKTSNCQSLVSLTLASREVPVMVGLRLFLPDSWIGDPARLDRAGVPQDRRHYRTKPEIVLAEIDRIRAAGVRFGCVLADAGYGLSASFRQGLSERGLTWAVGIPYKQKVYPADVEMIFPVAGRGRPRQRHIPNAVSIGAQEMLEQTKWQTVSWRRGTKGRLSARFSALRVRVADGTPQRIHDMGAQHLPGEEVWLVGEHRSTGERKYYLSNLPLDTTTKQLAGAIKARWLCEQAHQQLKEELGLDHFEGRSWAGLHRHCLMAMIAFAFLQNQRLKKAKGGKKSRRTTTTTHPASHPPGNPHRARTTAAITVPALP
jgi:SRSO17 transposase